MISQLTRATALAVYDLIQSFPAELRYIWSGRFGIGTILYLSIRYGPITCTLINALGSIVVPGNLIVSVAVRFIISELIHNMDPRGGYSQILTSKLRLNV